MRGAWWWVDRWRKSTAYTDLTLAEQGAYRNLLDELWLRDGLLPLDERILAKISGDALGWPSVRAAVMAHFKRGKDGYRNETHDEVADESRRRAEKQKRYRDSRRDGNGGGNGSGNASGNAPGNEHSNVTASPSPDPFSVLRSPDQDPEQRQNIVLPAAVPLALVPPPATSPRRTRRKPAEQADRLDTRAACDMLAEVMGKQASYSATMLEAFGHLLDAGRSPDEIRAVVTAYRDRSTPAATFSRDGQNGSNGGPGLAWALRPGEAGGFDKILLQLADSGPADGLTGNQRAAAEVRRMMEAHANGKP